MSLAPWVELEAESGSWIRKMYREGQRLTAEFGVDKVADLSIGQPLEVSPAVRQAFETAANEDFAGRFGYMPNSGYPELRERCAEDVNFAVSPRGVVVTSGAAGAIALALRAFVESGREILALAPYFPEFRLYATVLGSPFAAVPRGPGAGVNLEALAASLSPNTGALILNSPSNPSGHVLTHAELSSIAELLEAHNRRHNRRVLLVVDEVYRRIIYTPATHIEALAHYETTVLARSFSKDLGIAGERIGYLVLHPSLASAEAERGLELCARALGFVNASATAQRALLALDDWRIDLTPYTERRSLILDAVRSAGIEAVAPDGGIYLWARSPWNDTLAYVNHLARQRVLVTPGVAFGDETHFRICFTARFKALELTREVLSLADGTTAERAPQPEP